MKNTKPQEMNENSKEQLLNRTLSLSNLLYKRSKRFILLQFDAEKPRTETTTEQIQTKVMRNTYTHFGMPHRFRIQKKKQKQNQTKTYQRESSP